MKASEIFRSWLHRRSHAADDWQAEVREELTDQEAKGVSRREMVERLAKQMYAEDLRDIGSVADIGFFTWQLYLGAAQFVVNFLLPDEKDAQGSKSTQQASERDRRVA